MYCNEQEFGFSAPASWVDLLVSLPADFSPTGTLVVYLHGFPDQFIVIV
jgi:hypothetical protein